MMADLAPEPIKRTQQPGREEYRPGLRQAMEAGGLPDLLYSSTIGNGNKEYDEIFAYQGFQKKVLREIAEVKAETLANLNE